MFLLSPESGVLLYPYYILASALEGGNYNGKNSAIIYYEYSTINSLSIIRYCRIITPLRPLRGRALPGGEGPRGI
jgi:hypothetical protein